MSPRQKKWMFWTVWLLVVATLILVASKISFIFAPISAFFSTVFGPLVAASFLYYLVNPIVVLLERRLRIPRGKAVLAVLLALLLVLVVLFAIVIPALLRQITALVAAVPTYAQQVNHFFATLDQQPWVQQLNLQETLATIDLPIDTIVGDVLGNVTKSFSAVGAALSTVASAALSVLTIPFIFVYMLKDGDRLVPAIARWFPSSYRNNIVEALRETNKTIASYIGGQMLVCLFTGFFTGVGYALIGLPYAALLGVVAAITNLIPYVGPYLGLLPAVLVALTISPLQALLACVVVLVVQQIEANFVSPNVLGKSLDMHPLTIMFILLVSGSLFGVMGMVLAVPAYGVVKTLVIYGHRLYRELKERQKEDEHGTVNRSV